MIADSSHISGVRPVYRSHRHGLVYGLRARQRGVLLSGQMPDLSETISLFWRWRWLKKRVQAGISYRRAIKDHSGRKIVDQKYQPLTDPIIIRIEAERGPNVSGVFSEAKRIG